MNTETGIAGMGKGLWPLARRSLLREIVEDRLREAIMRGTLAPGQRLSDEDLKAWFGVSRTPIREALNELTRAGLVEMSPNRFTRVAPVCAEREALEVLQALGILLGAMLRYAIPHLGDGARAEIAQELELAGADLLGAEPAAGRYRAYSVCDRIAQATRNSHLLHAYRGASAGLFHKLPTGTLRNQADSGRVHHAMADLIGAVAEGTPALAEAAMHALCAVNETSSVVSASIRA